MAGGDEDFVSPEGRRPRGRQCPTELTLQGYERGVVWLACEAVLGQVDGGGGVEGRQLGGVVVVVVPPALVGQVLAAGEVERGGEGGEQAVGRPEGRGEEAGGRGEAVEAQGQGAVQGGSGEWRGGGRKRGERVVC